eukprot:2091059-Prymnesium_polylepis.1
MTFHAPRSDKRGTSTRPPGATEEKEEESAEEESSEDDDGEKETAAATVLAAIRRYTDGEYVFDLLRERAEDVKMISLNWLIMYAATGKPLPHRQELPQEAFVDVEMLHKAWKKLGRENGQIHGQMQRETLPFIAISYCWLSDSHPDKDGEQLRHVAKILEEARDTDITGQLDVGYSEYYPDMGVFWDWCSIYQKDPKLFDEQETPQGKSDDERDAFIEDLCAKRKFYGGERYENSRTLEQKAAFGRALSETMDVWYAHKKIVAVFVTKLPDGYAGRTYETRGWTSFERASAELIKPASCCEWPMCIDTTELFDGDQIAPGRRPPMTPDRFAQALRTKEFTNGSDKEAVAKLFYKTATTVLGATEIMQLHQMEVHHGDGAMIGEAIRLCQRIEDVEIEQISLGEEEACSLIQAMGALPSLTRLSLSDTDMGEAGALALAKALSEGQFPNLKILNYGDFGDFEDASGMALANAIENGCVPHLEALHLSQEAEYCDDTEAALRRVCREQDIQCFAVYDVDDTDE